MEIYIDKTMLYLKHKKEQPIACGIINNQQMSETFTELNDFWKSLDEKTLDELFSLYSDACFLLIEEGVTGNDNDIAEIIRVLLDDVHTYDALKDYCKDAIPPETSPEVYGDSKHYTKELTYTRPDYMELAILATRIKSLVPLFSASDLYLNNKSKSGSDVMNRILGYMFSIGATELYSTEVFDRLRVFVEHTCKNQNGSNINLAGTILEGIGSEELPDYLEGVAVIYGCAITPIKVKGKHIVKQINYRLSTELSERISKRFNVTKERSFQKMTAGEEKKPGYLDTYAAREEVPSSVPISMGVWGGNYRLARHALGIETPPNEIKEFITSIDLNPLPHLTKTHIQLIKIATFERIIYQTIPDIQAKYLINIMGSAQAWYLENKFYTLAKMMGAHAHLITRHRKDLSFTPKNYNPLSADTSELLDRYYSTKIPSSNLRNWVKPYEVTIDAIVDDISRYSWTIKSSKEVCDKLGTNPGLFTVDDDVTNELGRALALALSTAKKFRLDSISKENI